MDRTMKVFLSCALGAFVGALVALEVNGYLWWLGMLAGGLVGYFSYEFKEVITAIPRAWRAATSWRPDVTWWKRQLKSTLVYAALTAVFGLSVSSLFVTLGFLLGGNLHEISYFGLFGFAAGLMAGALMAAKEDEEESVAMALFLNPIGVTVVVIFLLILLVIGIWRLIPRVLIAIRIAGRFLKHLFKLIHSDERLLCAVDAAIGAGIGYWAGNAALGSLAGGLFGVVNYELISKLWLKLVPIEHS